MEKKHSLIKKFKTNNNYYIYNTWTNKILNFLVQLQDKLKVKIQKIMFCLVLLLSFSVFGQEKIMISGYVKTIKTEKPIFLADVFLVNTTLGCATNKDGFFRITNISPGQYTLIVRMVGYEEYEKKVTLSCKQEEITIYLKEKALQIEGVVVEAEKPGEWLRNLQKFKRNFFGLSEFADECEFENPEVLDFSYIPDTLDSVVGQYVWFRAIAAEPLIFYNKALGYKYVYYNFKFEVYNPEGELFYITNKKTLRGKLNRSGVLRLVDLKPENLKQQRKWKENRRKVYRGSFKHLLYSLAKDVSKDEGFELREVLRKLGAMGKVIDPKTIVKFDKTNNCYVLTFENIKNISKCKKIIKIIYKNERNEIRRKMYNFQISFVPNSGRYKEGKILAGTMYQQSFLELKAGECVKFDERGIIISKKYKRAIPYGYWKWAFSMAEMLPDNYKY